MSRDRAMEMAQLVDEIKANCPAMSYDACIRLAHAATQLDMMDDAVIILGDIADALNDMRPTPGSRETLH